MRVLVIDIGGTHVKIMATGHAKERKAVLGPTMSAKDMVDTVLDLAGHWKFKAVSMGYPGPVVHGKPVLEPKHLASGWVGFDFERAFSRPVRIVNDALMQAVGSYEGGRMLFLGLGTGLGSAMIVENVAQPMELAHLPYKDGRTFEDYSARRARAAGRERGRRRSPRWSPGSRPLSSPNTSCSAAATSSYSRTCRRAAGAATTGTRSPAAFASGATTRSRSELLSRRPSKPTLKACRKTASRLPRAMPPSHRPLPNPKAPARACMTRRLPAVRGDAVIAALRRAGFYVHHVKPTLAAGRTPPLTECGQEPDILRGVEVQPVMTPFRTLGAGPGRVIEPWGAVANPQTLKVVLQPTGRGTLGQPHVLTMSRQGSQTCHLE